MNCAPKRKPSKENPSIPLKERRKTATLIGSCTNWQPVSFQNEKISHKVKQIKLQNWYKMNETDPGNLKCVEEYMIECFSAQRVYLNNRIEIPTIVEIQ